MNGNVLHVLVPPFACTTIFGNQNGFAGIIMGNVARAAAEFYSNTILRAL